MDVDLYEHAYQTISKSISKHHTYLRKSDLRRMTIEKIREKLRLHIAPEDIDSRDYYNWQVEKKLNFLEDLNIFIYKTLGKKKYIKLRDLRNRE